MIQTKCTWHININFQKMSHIEWTTHDAVAPDHPQNFVRGTETVKDDFRLSHFGGLGIRARVRLRIGVNIVLGSG